jgi:hypothetical protein
MPCDHFRQVPSLPALYIAGRSAISIAIGPARQAIFDTSQRPVFAIGSDAEEAPRALHETTMRDA